MAIPSLIKTSGTQTSIVPICFNTGGLWDMANGNFLTRYDGSGFIINGGISPTNGLGGRYERFKSTIAISMVIQSMERYPGSELYLYDTEYSHTDRRRLASFSTLYLEDPVRREQHILELMERIIIKNPSDFQNIDEFMAFINDEVIKPKDEKRKLFMIPTPLINEQTHKQRMELAPTFVIIDSWSAGKTKAGMQAASAPDASDSANNMQYVRDSGAKNTTLARMLHASPRYGLYFFLTAHVREKMDLAGGGPMAKPRKDLQNMKANEKVNRVGSDYLFLVNSNWQVDNSSFLVNKNDKGSEYPFTDRATSVNEFSEVSLGTTRGKRKGSGDKFMVVVSQNDGVSGYLTYLELLKAHKYYGLGTDPNRPRLAFFPDIIIQRKRTHDILQPNYALRRALEITAQLCYFQHYWTAPGNIELPFDISPEDLAHRLELSGKKDEVMRSRGWWSYDFEDIPYYSLFDILAIVKDIPPLGSDKKK